MHHTNNVSLLMLALLMGDITTADIIDGWAWVPVVDEVMAGQLGLFE